MIDYTAIVQFSGRAVPLRDDVVVFDHMCWGKPCSQIDADTAGHTQALAKIKKDAKDRGENGLAEQGKYARDKGSDIVSKMSSKEISRGEASNRMKSLLQATKGDGVKGEHIKAMADAMDHKSRQHFGSAQRAEDAASKETDKTKKRQLQDKAYNERKYGNQAAKDRDHFHAFMPAHDHGIVGAIGRFIDRMAFSSDDPTKTVIHAGRIVHLD